MSPNSSLNRNDYLKFTAFNLRNFFLHNADPIEIFPDNKKPSSFEKVLVKLLQNKKLLMILIKSLATGIRHLKLAEVISIITGENFDQTNNFKPISILHVLILQVLQHIICDCLTTFFY